MDQVHRERMPDHLEISASAENLSNDTQVSDNCVCLLFEAKPTYEGDS